MVKIASMAGLVSWWKILLQDFLGWGRRCVSVCVFIFGLTLFVFAYLYFLWKIFWLYMEASSSVSGSRTGARTCRVGVRLALALVLQLQLQLALVLNPPWDDHLRYLSRPCPQPLQPGWRRSEFWNINSLQKTPPAPKAKHLYQSEFKDFMQFIVLKSILNKMFVWTF